MTTTPPNAPSIFGRALEIESRAGRAAYLDEACGPDAGLRAEVEGLLAAAEKAGEFMRRPAAAELTAGYEPLTEGPGTIIGPYRLMEQIGEGGFGLVFVAEQQEPVRRKVALKVIKPGMDTREVIARFEAERQALALMDHPNIARVLDAGATESGRPYFVMELVKGVPITDYCDRNQLTPRERLELFVGVCQAVQHAHTKGVIHRDIKPSNVLVTLHDGRPVVKVIDFGIAKAVGQRLTDKTVYTHFTQLIGTPLYMSPEQAEMSGLDIDTRSDVYSLGVLLYELLTGTTPFDGERLKRAAFDEVRRIIREEEPPRPSTRLSTLGATLSAVSARRRTEPGKLSALLRGDLDWVVMKGLEKDRARRYETASALAADVRRYLSEEPVEARPPSAGYRLRKFVKRHRGPVAAAAVVLLTLVAGVIGTTWGMVEALAARADESRQRQTAEDQRNRAVTAEAEARTNEQKAKDEEQKAKEATDEAVRLAKEEKAARKRAEENETTAELRLYASHIASAQRAFEADDFGLVDHYLKQCRPDFRGWEHDYLYTLANPNNLTLLGPTSEVLSVVFSPDGKRLASASRDKTVKVWDAATGREIRTVKLYTGPVGDSDLRANALLDVALAFSPDGKHLATATFPANYSPRLGTFGEVKLWDIESGQHVRDFKGHTGPVTSLAFSPNGKLLAGAGFGGSSTELRDTIKLWDAASGEEGPTVEGDNNGPSPRRRIGVAFSPDSKVLASASFDGTVKLWDAATGKVSQTLQAAKAGTKMPAGLLAFSPDGKLLVSSSFDKTVKLWHLASGVESLTFTGLTGDVQGVAFSPDNERIVLACADEKVIRVVDTVNRVRPMRTPDGKDVTDFESMDGKGSKFTVSHTFKSHTGYIDSLAISPDGKRMASASKSEAVVRSWNMASPRQAMPLTLKEHTAPVNSVAFSPDGNLLASGAGAIVSFTGFGNKVDTDLSFPSKVNGQAARSSKRVARS